MNPDKKFIMITHRAIEEGIAMEKGKNSREYFDACSIVEMNEFDISELGIEANTTVRIKSSCGEVLVSAIIARQSLLPGMCHMRQGVWANQIVPAKTQSTGTPQYSGFLVTIHPANGERIIPARELILRSIGMWKG